jgi:hypothetical protein
MRTRLIAVGAVLALLLSACGDNDDTEATPTEPATEAPEEEATDAELDEALATFGFESEEADVPQLDLATLEAEAPGMTVQAQPVDNAFVGEVTDDIFIAIAPDQLPAAEADEVMAYLCDDEGLAIVMTGELGDDGTATLSEEQATVELAVTGDQIAGSVTLDGEQIGQFTATAATGEAGLYEVTGLPEDSWARWVVLEDGRQRGGWCIGIRAGNVCIGISRN